MALSRSYKILQMCNSKVITGSVSGNGRVDTDSDEHCGTQSVKEDTPSLDGIGLDLQETTFFPASGVPALCTTSSNGESNETGDSVILIPDKELLNLISLASSTTQDNKNPVSCQKDDDFGLNIPLELGLECVLNSEKETFLDIPLSSPDNVGHVGLGIAAHSTKNFGQYYVGPDNTVIFDISTEFKGIPAEITMINDGATLLKEQGETDILTFTSVTQLEESGLSKLKTKKVNKRKQIRENKVNDKMTLKPNACKGTCKNECSTISEEDRQLLFNEYYKIKSYEQKKTWLLNCMVEVEVKRKRTKTLESRRRKTIEYTVRLHGVTKKVCQNFLISSLSISQMTLRHTISNATNTNTAKPDMRGKHTPKNKTPTVHIQTLKNFIEGIPVVPSHYCRKKCKKLYLPSEIGNLANLERLYRNHCKENNTRPVGRTVFRNTFKEYNFGFHVPKKDKCSHCEMVHQIGVANLDEVARKKYEKHIHEVEESKKEFSKDQENKSENILCASFDLQKVLNTPCGQSMLLYYSRKISVFNFTVYESRTKNGFCYLWDETKGKKGSNEICTALMEYLQNVDQNRPQINKVVMYCDNCAGQNKNKQILVMLHTFLKTSKNIKEINLKYLIAGHTYMPADSIHSTIDTFIRKKIIYAPSQWPTVISLSRHQPRPYAVFLMTYDKFKDWAKHEEESKCIPQKSEPPCPPKESPKTYLQSTHSEDVNLKVTEKTSRKRKSTVNSSEGKENEVVNKKKKVRKPKKMQGKALRISKVTSVFFRKNCKSVVCRYSNITQEADEQEFIFKDPIKGVTLKRCYTGNLPISTLKYKDLQKLCKNNAISQQYHEEYKRMIHSNSVVDELVETDEEDEVPENDDDI